MYNMCTVCIYVCMYVCMYVLYCEYFLNQQKLGGTTSVLTDALDVRFAIQVRVYVCLNCTVDNLLVDKEYSDVQSLQREMHFYTCVLMYVCMSILHCKTLQNKRHILL
jgi:hypothetical protein